MKRLRNLFEMRSLRWQLILRFFLLLLLLLTVMEISQYVIMKQYLYKSKEQLLESRYHNVEIAIKEHIKSPQDVRNYASYLIKNTLDINMSIAIIDANGNFVSESSKSNKNLPTPHLSPEDYKKLLRQKGDLEGNRILRDGDNDQIMVIWRKLGSNDTSYGLIQLSTSAESAEEILETQLYVYIIASVLILIIGWILAKGVLQNALKPLYKMTNTVEQITVGQLDIRLAENNGQLEVDRLSTAFNGMLERIEASFEKEQKIKEKMRQFISDASHELRTPLTSIHGFVEVLLRGAAKNEKQLNSALNSILIESERLTKLVNDLLLLTKLDQSVPLEKAVENMNNIIEEVYPQLQIICGKRKIKLQLEENLFVLVNRNQMKQVVFNLVHNAVHHTDEEDGVIIISLNSTVIENDSFAVLKVKDNGTGIPKKDLNEIFDRFFRSESHRSRKHGGYGLGLSIVKSIIDTHDGKIQVDSELGKGTTFTILLNLYTDSER